MPPDTQQPTTSARGHYRRHFIREKKADRPPLQIQGRDIEILQAVFEHRFLIVPLLASIFPPSEQDRTRRYMGYPVNVTDETHSNLRRRLRKLFHHAYLTRFHLPTSAEHVYALDNRGAELLRERQLPLPLSIDWTEKNRDVKTPYVEHTLMVARFRVALELATRVHPKISLEHFERESLDLKAEWKRDNKRVYVNPDAFFILKDESQPSGQQYLNYFLEADRSTMQLSRMLDKYARYSLMFQDNIHKQAFDVSDFRVLTITKSRERASNLASITADEAAPIPHAHKSLYYFTTEETYSEHPPNSLASIWRRADAIETVRGIIAAPLKRT